MKLDLNSTFNTIIPICPKKGKDEETNIRGQRKCRCELPCDPCDPFEVQNRCKGTIANWIFILISFIFTCF
eukprot:11823.XXX_673393_673661_1 [CDS] Oithona nana genome sequencing.